MDRTEPLWQIEHDGTVIGTPGSLQAAQQEATALILANLPDGHGSSVEWKCPFCYFEACVDCAEGVPVMQDAYLASGFFRCTRTGYSVSPVGVQANESDADRYLSADQAKPARDQLQQALDISLELGAHE